jgi:hypothetical protein
MKPALRIPLVLAWTALSGAGLTAASSCSSTTQGQGAADSASNDGPVQDGQPSMEASAMEASSADVSPIECEGIIDGAIVFFQDDAGICPDGDTPIVV